MLDFTDFNLIHAALFTFAAVSVLAEQTLRARYGQHAYKDQTALVALLTFWFGLENYFRLVVLVFS